MSSRRNTRFNSFEIRSGIKLCSSSHAYHDRILLVLPASDVSPMLDRVKEAKDTRRVCASSGHHMHK